MSSGSAVEAGRKLPPMLQQYLEYKKNYPDNLLMFQVGDFYEAFFEDAVILAQSLNITLTSRDKNTDNPIPMAGVPIAVIDSYLDRLVQGGFSVAIVSQTEQPSGKGMVARKLERIVTPGIKLAGGLEDEDSDSIVAAVSFEKDPRLVIKGEAEFSVAFSSVQSGKIQVVESVALSGLIARLSVIGIRELIVPRELNGKAIDRRAGWIRELEQRLSDVTVKFRSFDTAGSERDVAAIAGYSALAPGAKKAGRLLIHYIDETIVDVLLPISRIDIESSEGRLLIDSTTRRNLELVENSRDGGIEGTLLSSMDRTRTLPGKRTLRRWILSPLTELEAITNRQLAVGALIRQFLERQELQEQLRYMVDFERIAARLELNIVSPRELGALRDAVQRVPSLREILKGFVNSKEGCLEAIVQNLETSPFMLQLLERALVDSPPASLKDAGVFKSGHNEDLDRLREIKTKGKGWIAELELKEKENTGISSLKIKFNNVHGYFFEVTKAHLDKIPENYQRKQTMVNCERFITEELKRFEQEVLGASDKQKILERKLYEELKGQARPYTSEIRKIAEAVSELDVLLSLAELAELESYVEPVIDQSEDLEIIKGKHPVVSQFLQGGFIANSTELHSDSQFCAIMTGANMGGKSTWLRQAALILIMAQMGSFVPAESARVGIADRVFARLGASDDLLEGESTFMVEMREAAYILSNATSSSLVLIDEIGRGTATGDGLAIAQAVLEWMVLKLKCRTLFATHFHELTLMEDVYEGIENLSVSSVDKGGRVVFTHQIQKGAANNSYGLEVAALAGLPKKLVSRARVILSEFGEKEKIRAEAERSVVANQLSIFAEDPVKVESEKVLPDDYEDLVAMREVLEKIEVNAMTPLEALNWISDFKKELEG